MAKRRGMSMNVAVALGHVSVRPRRIVDGDSLPSRSNTSASPIIDLSPTSLPCQYSSTWHRGGLSPMQEYKMNKEHASAIQREFRL